MTSLKILCNGKTYTPEEFLEAIQTDKNMDGQTYSLIVTDD